MRESIRVAGWTALLILGGIAGCKSQADTRNAAAKNPPMGQTSAAPNAALSPADALKAAQALGGPQPDDNAPAAPQTGGIDGHRALELVAKQLAYGPRPSDSAALQQLQSFLKAELAGYGCTLDVDDFQVDTPVGHRKMENILVKIPGQKPGIILLGTHYDTATLPGFVGAFDAASSTAIMLEIARSLCGPSVQPAKYSVWIAFFDGEEAQNNGQWSDTDSVYGSREMAARLSNSGDLPKVRAFMLADLVGGKTAHYKRDTASTAWLVDLVWKVAGRLGYTDVFVDDTSTMGGDDDFPFLNRKVAAVDVFDFDTLNDAPYWHNQNGADTLDKISARNLAITGHVFLETVKELQAK
ncbi:MAG: M28 family peptidase [Candidatus Acidiferrum sp.]